MCWRGSNSCGRQERSNAHSQSQRAGTPAFRHLRLFIGGNWRALWNLSSQATDLRPRLYEKLQAFLRQVRSTNLGITIIVNGSFVTGKADPNDIDLILVLPSSHDLRAELVPMAYNVLSKRRVSRQYGFDILVAREDAIEYTQYVEFFQQVRGQPHLYKGVLRIGL
jgi:predicted nucleotidyltransferase